MSKILIIGSSGAGKTTLARALSLLYDTKVYHLDRLFWRRNWGNKPFDTRFDALQQITQEQSWIIEGNYAYSTQPAWEMADTIIFLDLPLTLCLQRVIERYCFYNGLPRRDLPLECVDNFGLQRATKLISFFIHKKKELQKQLAQITPGKVTHLQSPQEVDAFFELQMQKASTKIVASQDETISAHYPQLVNYKIQPQPIDKTPFNISMLIVYNILVLYHKLLTLPSSCLVDISKIWQITLTAMNIKRTRPITTRVDCEPRSSALELETIFNPIQQSPIPR